MCGPVKLFISTCVLGPRQIFTKLGRSNPRKTHPDQMFSNEEQPAAPAQDLPGRAAHRRQVEGCFQLESLPVGEHDVTIHGCEVDRITHNVAIVGPLDGNIDPSSRLGQGNRVPLLKACHPYLIVELKDMIGMGAMRFGGCDGSIVNLAGEALPWVFPKYVPLPKHGAFGADFDYHVESGDCNQQGSFSGRINVMKIVEAGQRNVIQEPEAGKLIDQNFSRSTGEQFVIQEKS